MEPVKFSTFPSSRSSGIPKSPVDGSGRLRPILAAIAVVGSVGFLLSCNQDETAFGPQDGQAFESSVAGRVTDRNGKPLSGALVTALPGGATTVSGPDGSFTLAKLTAGSYRIALAKDDYLDTLLLDSVRIGLSVKRDIGALGMRYRYATIKGVVEDSSGTGQPTAAIAVEDQMSTTMAMNGGRFTLGRVEPGRVRLFTAIQGLGYGSLDTVLKAEDTLKDVKLRILHKGGAVTGQVVGNDGKGIQGAQVQTVGGALRTVTDGGGFFRITEVPGGGKVVVEIAKGELSTLVTGVRVAEGSRTDLSKIAIVDPSSSEAVSIRAGLAMAMTTDSVAMLVADTISKDSAFRILRYLWSLDNGSTWDTTSTNLFKVYLKKLGWSSGNHPVLVKVVSVDGKVSATGTITVRLMLPPDWTAPTVQRKAPTDTVFAWRDSVATFSWTVSDDRRLDSVWIDDKATGVDSGRYSRQVPLPVGRSFHVLMARDSAGNVARDTIVVERAVRDTVNPEVERLSPKQDTILAWKDSSFAATWRASDDQGLDSAWIGGIGAAIADSGKVSQNIALKVGANMIRIRVRDLSNNEIVDSLKLTRLAFDTTRPKIVRISPTKDTTFASKDTSATVSWKVSDIGTGLDSVWIDGGFVKPDSTGKVSTKVSLVSGGTVKVRIRARDLAGLVMQDSLWLKRSGLDTTKPTLARSTPTKDTTYASSDTSATVSWMVSDVGTGLDSVWIDGGYVKPDSAGKVTTMVSLVSGGTVKVRIRARDLSGNVGIDSLELSRQANSIAEIPGKLFTSLTADSGSGGVAFTNMAPYDAGNVIYRVFDGDNSTFYSTALGVVQGYVGIRLPEPRVCNVIGVMIPESFAYINAYLYNGFSVYGSNDQGMTYTKLPPANSSSWILGRMNYVSLANANPYSTYKIVIEGVNHDNVGIQEIGLYFEKDSSWRSSAYLSNALETLEVEGALSPAFDSTTTSYVDTVASSTKELTIHASASSPVATVKINGASVDSGKAIPVDVSTDTTISIVVSNPNRWSARTYTLRVVHKAAVVDTTFGIPWNSAITYGFLHDARDGQEYRTVKIGSQTWMAENLNLRDTGTGGDTVGACYNDMQDSCRKYGRMYRWTDAMAGSAASATTPSGVRGLCPTGWHLPSDAEWDSLAKAVGGSDAAGSALKSTSGWNASGSGSDNYGFRAIPAGSLPPLGYRSMVGNALDAGSAAVYWSSTVAGSAMAWRRRLESASVSLDRGDNGDDNWYSIRCLEDYTPAPQDTTLASLTISKGILSPAFAKTKMVYADTVYDSLVRIEAHATDTSVSTVSIDGKTQDTLTVALAPGETKTVIVKVASKDADFLEYNVTLHRENTYGIPWNSAITYGVLHDARDGQVYRTVEIGTQTWMAENLNYAGASSTIGVCGNDSCDKYGRQYTWNQVMNGVVQGICPEGWHVPGNGEWTELVSAAGSAEALRSTAGWNSPTQGGDASGFRALPAGEHLTGIIWLDGGHAGNWWSSTAIEGSSAWYRRMAADSGMQAAREMDKSYGLSVRCVAGAADSSVSLKLLSVDSGSLDAVFDSARLGYVDSVGYSVKRLSLTLAAVSSAANVSIGESSYGSAGTIAIDAAMDTTLVINVGNPNAATTKSYTLKIVHKAIAVDTTFGIPWNPAVTYGVLHDARDGQEYRTVMIGGRTWMAENLNYKGSGGDSGWAQIDSPDSTAKYGRVYSWGPMMGLADSCKAASCSTQISVGSQGVCPDGWHVPSDGEWSALFASIGGQSAAWTKLRSATGWLMFDGSGFRIDGTDDFGFRSLPAGQSGTPGYNGRFWSASESSATEAWSLDFDYFSTNVLRATNNKAERASLRCVQ